MENLPSNVLTKDDIELLENAGQMIIEAVKLKESPSKLRLYLVEIQAARFEIGRRRSIYKGKSRDAFTGLYAQFKLQKMSPNAAAKEAEAMPGVVELKNTADLFDTAYEVMDAFVNTNQTSLRLAAEEAKNNL